MDTNMQFTINSFRQLFPDKIFSLTVPWFSVKSLTCPWQLSNSLTFPGFPDKWSPWNKGIRTSVEWWELCVELAASLQSGCLVTAAACRWCDWVAQHPYVYVADPLHNKQHPQFTTISSLTSSHHPAHDNRSTFVIPPLVNPPKLHRTNWFPL